MIMPRVVPDQRNKFYTDELFKKLSRETEVIIKSRFYIKYVIVNYKSIFQIDYKYIR